MKVGYARVSTFEQDLDLQLDALKKRGAIASSATRARVERRPIAQSGITVSII